MGGGGQHHIGVGGRIRHGDIDHHGEDIIAGQAPAHGVLVGMHDERIVVIDHQAAQGRVHVIVGQMAAHVDDVQGAGAFGDQIRAGQLAHGLGEQIARAADQAGGGMAELAGQGGQREDGADARTTVSVPLQAVARGDGGGLRRFVPRCQL